MLIICYLLVENEEKSFDKFKFYRSSFCIFYKFRLHRKLGKVAPVGRRGEELLPINIEIEETIKLDLFLFYSFYFVY
jgi:hypothetical protein